MSYTVRSVRVCDISGWVQFFRYQCNLVVMIFCLVLPVCGHAQWPGIFLNLAR
jgi:hypothetical protein